MDPVATRPLGWQLHEQFRVLDVRFTDFDAAVVADMLKHGHCDGAVVYVLRGAVPKSTCDRISGNFLRQLNSHGSTRPDDGFVKVKQIGSTQFDKSGDAYARQTIAVQPDMYALFDNLDSSSVTKLMLDDVLVPALLKQGLHFGPARYKSTYANHCTVRAWLDNGGMSLHPHDDISQLETAKLDRFEIEAIRKTLSFNTCVRNQGGGGQLRVWDLHPSPELRRSFGVFNTGYPYPMDFVDTLPSITVELQEGDSYFLNASFLHGVLPAPGLRITSGRFIGAITDDKVVHWT